MRIISGTAKGTKLVTLEGIATRPTLDRIKESLFNIIQKDVPNSIVLDLFAGSGALGIESLSRGASRAILVDNSRNAIEVIKANVQKTKFETKVQIIQKDYKTALKQIVGNAFDLIFLDPPYETNFAVDAVKRIVDLDILKKDGMIIVETDQEKRELEALKKIDNIQIQDLRSYGRVKLLFLNRKG